jgi:hypothetical protein
MNAIRMISVGIERTPSGSSIAMMGDIGLAALISVKDRKRPSPARPARPNDAHHPPADFTGTKARASAVAPRSIAPRHTAATGLEQEPRAPLGLVDPILEQAGAGHVFVLVGSAR